MINIIIIPLVSLALIECNVALFHVHISNLHHIALDGKLTVELERIDSKKVLSCHMAKVILENNKEPQ